MRLGGKNCFDVSDENRFGHDGYPFKGSLAGIDILNGGCDDVTCYLVVVDGGKQLNTRCKQSQADSVFMFLTVVVLFVVLLLTYRRMRRG